MHHEPTPPESATLQIVFRCVGPLEFDEAQAFAGRIATGLPTPPDDVAVDPGGHGWVAYGSDDGLTLAQLSEAARWLRQAPEITKIWCSLDV